MAIGFWVSFEARKRFYMTVFDPESDNSRRGSPEIARSIDDAFREVMKGAFPSLDISAEDASPVEILTQPKTRGVPSTNIFIPEERNISPILVMKVGESIFIRAEQFRDPEELRMSRTEMGQVLDEKLSDVLYRAFSRELERAGISSAPTVIADGIISKGKTRVSVVFSQFVDADTIKH